MSISQTISATIICVVLCQPILTTWHELRHIRAEESEAERATVPFKPKILRSNPYRYTTLANLGVPRNELVIEDEDAIHNGRKAMAPETTKLDLSDEVRFRLWLARQLALARYDRVWS